MQTPHHKVSDAIGIEQISVEAKGKAMQRKSPRIEEKNNNGKTIIKLAQDLVAKKCDIIKDDEVLDNTTLQQYLDMYNQPLTKHTMEAIIKLTQVAE
jgi:ribulose 1,5-bisphosphate carboxylase large subunit-like protein